jgi:hypothetical protein
MKGNLVWLPLRCTRRHQANHFLLHVHVTSAMMPRAPPVIAPSLVLRQNWKALAQLASRRIKPPDVDVCPHIVFIYSSVLRGKPTNLLPLGFKAQTKKPSWWFWGPKQVTVALVFRPNHWQTIAVGFEAKLKNPRFSSPPRVRCRSHTASPDLLIVRPPSTRLVPDHPRSSTSSLLLLPQSSSFPSMSHSPPTCHKHKQTRFSIPNNWIWVSSTEMRRIQIQTRTSQLLITHINQGTNHLVPQSFSW